MMSAMLIAAILEAADVNDARGYYHYRDGPNFARDLWKSPTSLLCLFVVLIISPGLLIIFISKQVLFLIFQAAQQIATSPSTTLSPPDKALYQSTWKTWAPTKCRFFVWLVALNKCWTANRLAR
jgi:hypothetical protein